MNENLEEACAAEAGERQKTGERGWKLLVCRPLSLPSCCVPVRYWT